MSLRNIKDRIRDPNEDPRRWNRLLDEVGVPIRHRMSKLDSVKGDKSWLVGALENPNDWLGIGAGYYLNGDYCTGKTSAAALLAMDALMRMQKVLWCPIRLLPPMCFEETERGVQMHRLLHKADLLVIDDLGSERFRITSAAGQAIEDCVRAIYDRNRSVVITSNVPWQTFKTTYPERLVSVVQRCVWPVDMNDKWPETPGA